MNGSNYVSSIGERPLIARLSEIFKSTLSPEIMIGVGPDDCAVIDLTETKRRHQMCFILYLILYF